MFFRTAIVWNWIFHFPHQEQSPYTVVIAEYWGAHWHVLLCSVGWFERWGALAFLWTLFVSSISLAAFSTDTDFFFFCGLLFSNRCFSVDPWIDDMWLDVVSFQIHAPRRGFVWVGGCLAFRQGVQPIKVGGESWWFLGSPSLCRRELRCSWSSPAMCSTGFDEVSFDGLADVSLVEYPSLRSIQESQHYNRSVDHEWFVFIAQNCRRLFWIASRMWF